MATVMIFPLHNTTAWWRHVASRLTFASRTVLVADLHRNADINITPDFYRVLNGEDAGRIALDALGLEASQEVIERCRFLKTLDRGLALAMIGAMWKVLDDVVERERPDVVLSCVVDRYVLDVFARVLERRGIRYIGLAVAPTPDQVMFMAKGEYLPVREPSDEEVDRTIELIVSPAFRPYYLPVRPRYDLKHFARIYARFTLRWLAFEVLRRWEDTPLDFRYRSACSIAPGYRVRLEDWAVMSHLDSGWEARLDAVPFERRVFLALPVTPEAAILYWVQQLDLIDEDAVFERAVEVLVAAGHHIFVKDHPNQFAFRKRDFIERLARTPGVTFVPYDVSAKTLIDRCKTTMTLTGTVGFEAVMAGRCAVVAASAYYAADPYFVTLDSFEGIAALPQMIERFVMPGDLAAIRRAIMRRLLRACLPGRLAWVKWSPDSPAAHSPDAVIESLNSYALPLAKCAGDERQAAQAIG